MTNNILLTILILGELLVGSYFLGRYISKSKEIFDNNPFAGWVLGFITNFFLTFAAFFPFTWISTPIIYFVIVFFAKECLMYTFLLMKREEFIHDLDWKNVLIILGSSVAITLIYNYGIARYTSDSSAISTSDFNSWFTFKNVLAHFSKIPPWMINKWLLSFLSASLAFSTVTAFVIEITRGYNKYDIIIGFLITLLILTIMGVGIRIEDTAGYFLLLFMIITAIRLIIYSRRRYAAQFGITSFVAWTIDSRVFIAATVLAFVTTIVYTFLKKPRASLFWVQLIAPQIMLMSLELHWVSNVVVIPLFILSAGIYIFMLSINSVKFLGKFNQLVVRYRVLIPSLMLTTLIVASIIVISTKDINIAWMDMKTTSSVLFRNQNDSVTSSVIQMIIGSLSLVFMLIKLFFVFKKNRNIHWREYIYIFVLLLTVFMYNPFIERMFESTKTLSNQMSHLEIIVVTPFLISLVIDFKKYIKVRTAK